MPEYREMNINDYEQCIELWKVSEGVGVVLGDTKEEIISYLGRNPGMSFVCLDTEKNILIGTVLCGHDGRRGFIYHLAVSENYRGKSIAKTLIDLSLEKLKAAGLKRCIILARDSNERGLQFWEKLNWNKRDLIAYSTDL